MATCAEKTVRNRARRTWRIVAATILTTALLLAAALVVVFRPTDSALPESFREMPLTVTAEGDPISVLSDDDLRVLVERVKPSWERSRVSALIHCLRLSGADTEISLPPPTGSRMLDAAANTTGGRPGKTIPLEVVQSPMAGWKPAPRVLCDDDTFQATFGPGPPFLMWQRDGLATRQALNDRAAAHLDDLLAAAAEAGLPLSTPISAGGRAGTLRDLLCGAIARFEINQELEFTAVALAAYLPPVKAWTNQRGETFTFDDVARKLLEPVTPKQACYGTHVPYALAFLVRIDEIEPILAADVRSDVLARLRRLSGELESRQDESGAWAPDRIQRDPLDEGGDLAKFRVTGHHLEWIALAPPEVRPSNECIERAARWLYKAILQQPAAYAYFGTGYNDNTHAARALLLLHHRTAAEFCSPEGAPP